METKILYELFYLWLVFVKVLYNNVNRKKMEKTVVTGPRPVKNCNVQAIAFFTLQS